MSSIHDLPPEMICKLFEHLSWRDLITCSMVNRLWRSLYSAVRLHRLAVDAHDFLGCEPGMWIYPDRMIEEQEVCKFKVFRRLIDQPFLSHLKHFAFCGSEHHLEELNGFLTESRQLVQLELNITFHGEVKVHLKLPRLKVLAFHKPNLECSLSLECPELNVLLYREHPIKSLLEVKYPETIRKLETNMFGEKLAPFKGVECLVIRGSSLEAICKSSLLSLPRLKEFHYNEDISRMVRYNLIDPLKQRLGEFLDDVQKLKGTDFQFTFAGFRMNEAMLDQIEFGGQVDEWLYLKNYQLIDGALDFIRSVDYSRLINDELPSCFSKKFTGIQNVYACSPIQDPDHFLHFLKSLSLLRSLTLNGSPLDQEFYNQLPVFARSLSKLFLNGQHGGQLDFSFIAKFSRLNYLSIDAQLSWQSLASLVACVGSLNEGIFSFRFNGHSHLVGRRDCKVYDVIQNYQTQLKTENPNEVLHYFQKLYQAFL